MARYVTRMQTEWPPEKAFAYLADLRNFADWDPGVKASVQVAGNGAALGSAYDVTVEGVGRDLTLRYELVECRQPERFTARAESSWLTSVDTVTVETAGDGAIVTYDAELNLRGLLALGDPLLGLAFRKIGDRAASGMRAALDGVDADR